MTEAKGFLFLSDETLAGLGIATTDVIDCIETTIRAQAEGKVWAAPKASILPGDGRYMMATLAASDTPRIIAIKSVMVNPRNPARGLAGINGACSTARRGFCSPLWMRTGSPPCERPA
jgi:ornithine cyclodeaminase/alanine dehydrogenase